MKKRIKKSYSNFMHQQNLSKLIILAFAVLVVCFLISFPIFTSAGYSTSGTLTSTNLLSGKAVVSIDFFGYNASSIPSGTSLKVQFSQDNSNWKNSAGTLNGWDTLSSGSHIISLSSLGWSGPNFYYKVKFESDGSNTPVLDDINVSYTPYYLIKRIGLSSNENKTNLLSQEKITAFQTKCVSNYENIRKLIDTEYYFSLELINKSSGLPIIDCNPPTIVIRPAKVLMNRIVALGSDTFGELTVQVWERITTGQVTPPTGKANGESCSADSECTSTYCYRDADSDGYAADSGDKVCKASGSLGTDCNDADGVKWQNLQCCLPDQDGDGVLAYASSVCSGSSCPTGYQSNCGTDCNDNNVQMWQNLLCYPDTDNDNYGAGTITNVCRGATCEADAGQSPPNTYSSVNTDCYDSNANAYPGQFSYFTTNRGDGSFDYDCNGVADKQFQWTCGTSLTVQSCTTSLPSGTAGWVSGQPVCGSAGIQRVCTSYTTTDCTLGVAVGTASCEACYTTYEGYTFHSWIVTDNNYIQACR